MNIHSISEKITVLRYREKGVTDGRKKAKKLEKTDNVKQTNTDCRKSRQIFL